MSLASWIKNHTGKTEEGPLSIDDLIVLERFEEAKRELNLRIKSRPKDLIAQRKLAEVYHRMGQSAHSVEMLLAIAEAYGEDGFYDKALAQLTVAQKLSPTEDRIAVKISKLHRMKSMDKRQEQVVMKLLEKAQGRNKGGSQSYLDVQRFWANLTASPVIESLPMEELQRLFGEFETVSLGPGKIVAYQGQELEELYLIAEGKLRATIRLEGDVTPTLREFEPGEVLGESALLDHQPWPATIETVRRSMLLRLKQDGLEALIAASPNPKILKNSLGVQQNDAQLRDAARKALK
ncbi:MAG: cyclic nucleotide-binding domain-containing protein [Thermoanaerobaculia bacterium]